MSAFRIRRVLNRDIQHMVDPPAVALETIKEIDDCFLDEGRPRQVSSLECPAFRQVQYFVRYAFALFSLSVYAAGNKWVHPPWTAYVPLLVWCEMYPETNYNGKRCTPIPWTRAGLVEAERLFGCARGIWGRTTLTRSMIRCMHPEDKLLWKCEWRDALIREGRRLVADGYKEGPDFVLTSDGVIYPLGSRYTEDMRAPRDEVDKFYEQLHSDPELFCEFWKLWMEKARKQAAYEAIFPPCVEFYTGNEWPLKPPSPAPSAGMLGNQAEGWRNATSEPHARATKACAGGL